MGPYVIYKSHDGKEHRLEAYHPVPTGSEVVKVFEEPVKAGDVLVYPVSGIPGYRYINVGTETIFPTNAYPVALIRDKRILVCLERLSRFVRRYALANELI